MRSLPGTTLEGRYHVLEMIGEGGMGHVFLAEHVTLKRKVAIKVLREELASQPANVERFFQEAQAASSIHHPNVVDVTDFGRASNGLVYFVMEHLVGEELTAMMHRHGSLPWPSAQAIILQVVRGLRATHEQGVVYRDLKPANIFLTRDPNGALLVKLLDFGIAKHTGNTARPRTKPNSVFGTARYMSPEQAGGKEVDARSDIYATGVVLYELLAGRAPFESDNYMEVVRCHVNDPIPRLREVAPRDADIPEAVESLVMRALEKDPAKRFHDMSEFEAAIQAADMDDATRVGALAASGGVIPESFDDVDSTMIWDAEQGRVAREAKSASGRVQSPDQVDATRIRPRPDIPDIPEPVLHGRAAARVVAPPGAAPRRSTVIASHMPAAPPAAAAADPVPPPMQSFHQPVFQSMDAPKPADPEPAPHRGPEVRRGDGAFFAPTTAGAGGSNDGRDAPVLPFGSGAPAPGGSSPHKHQTLPPVNWNAGAPNPPTGNHVNGPDHGATEEFALRLPERAPSRNRAVVFVVLAAVLVIGVGVAAWAVFFNDADPVGDDVYPTVVAEDLEPLPLGKGRKPKSAEPDAIIPITDDDNDVDPRGPAKPKPTTVERDRKPRPEPIAEPEPIEPIADPEPIRDPDPEPTRDPDPEPERPRKQSKPRKKGDPVVRGFAKAKKAIKACGSQHGALAGTAFNVDFDVKNGRASNVKVRPPHSVTSLGRCVNRAVSTHARFSGGDRVGQTQRVKF